MKKIRLRNEAKMLEEQSSFACKGILEMKETLRILTLSHSLPSNKTQLDLRRFSFCWMHSSLASQRAATSL